MALKTNWLVGVVVWLDCSHDEEVVVDALSDTLSGEGAKVEEIKVTLVKFEDGLSESHVAMVLSMDQDLDADAVINDAFQGSDEVDRWEYYQGTEPEEVADPSTFKELGAQRAHDYAPPKPDEGAADEEPDDEGEGDDEGEED